MPGLRPLYKSIAERHVPGETVVVASSLAFAARIAHDKLGMPLVTVHLSPAVFRSLFDGPRLAAGAVGSLVPKPLKQLQYWMADTLADHYLAGPINALRGELGLAPIRGVIDAWWNSPQRVLGFFPAWYRPPQPDWPPQLQLTGFPLYDERGVSEPSEDVRGFFASGDRPIVFTPGSANVHGQKFFAAAIEACQQLGRRGVLLTRFPEATSGAFARERAAFSTLFLSVGSCRVRQPSFTTAESAVRPRGWPPAFRSSSCRWASISSTTPIICDGWESAGR